MSGRIKRPDGSVEFLCAGCGLVTYMPIDDGFDRPVCMMCRWMGERPKIRTMINRMILRGKQAIGPCSPSSSPVDGDTPRAQRCGSGTPTLHFRGADTQGGGSVLGLLVLVFTALVMIVGAIVFAVV